METLRVDELIIGTPTGKHLRLTAGRIDAYDAHNRRRFFLELEAGDLPCLMLCDGNEMPRVRAGVEAGGEGYLVLNDGNGAIRLELRVNDEGKPEQTFYSPDEDPLLSFEEDTHGRVTVMRTNHCGGIEPWVPTPATI